MLRRRALRTRLLPLPPRRSTGYHAVVRGPSKDWFVRIIRRGDGGSFGGGRKRLVVYVHGGGIVFGVVDGEGRGLGFLALSLGGLTAKAFVQAPEVDGAGHGCASSGVGKSH